MSKKLFVSLPMRGYSIDEIRDEMQYFKDKLEKLTGNEYELINTIWTEDVPDDVVNNCYYLGKSIMELSRADICVFHPRWREANGCIVEHAVCTLYDIFYIEFNLNENSEETDEHDIPE